MYLKVLSTLIIAASVAACVCSPKTSTSSNMSSGSLEVAAGSIQDFSINAGDRVFFEFEKYTLTQDARDMLDKQVAWLKKYPKAKVTVEGHCDERGTREYNIGLGERRANAVKNYLTALGVDSRRLRTVSYGKEKPVALGQNEASWSQNRRAVTVVK